MLDYDTQDPNAGEVSGKLRLVQRTGIGFAQSITDQEQQITLKPGKNVIGFKQKLEVPGLHTLRATFVPDDPAADFSSKNNEATAFAQIRGKGRVLLIGDVDSATILMPFADTLRKNELEVDLIQLDQLFTSPAMLMQYDCIVLVNVPRSNIADSGTEYGFSDEQIRMLVKNTEELGCGLMMIGGDVSFGAGGWNDTEIEKAMPVNFQIKNDKVLATGCAGDHHARLRNGSGELLAAGRGDRIAEGVRTDGLLWGSRL